MMFLHSLLNDAIEARSIDSIGAFDADDVDVFHVLDVEVVVLKYAYCLQLCSYQNPIGVVYCRLPDRTRYNRWLLRTIEHWIGEETSGFWTNTYSAFDVFALAYSFDLNFHFFFLFFSYDHKLVSYGRHLTVPLIGDECIRETSPIGLR